MIVKKLILLLTIILFFTKLSGKDIPFAKVSDSSLLHNANAVLRNEVYKVEFINSKNANLKRHFAITILNASGQNFAELVIPYNTFQKVEAISGTLYDANGKKIKSLKKLDIKDFSAVDDISLADDTRVKYYKFEHFTFPYTVEFEYEIEYDSPIFINHYMLQEAEFISVEHSELQIISPTDYKFKYLQVNSNTVHDSTNLSSNKYKLSWNYNKVNSYRHSFADGGTRATVPTIYIAPENFMYGKYNGSLASWNTFGKLLYELHQPQSAIPTTLAFTLDSLKKLHPQKKELVSAIYKWMQSCTRYISVQLGTGGWQPFSAEYVYNKKYGDCKALSNYMHSMLKYVGISSYPAIINAGNNAKGKYFLPNFVCSQFNHEILCVTPTLNDTMWLECTSAYLKPGYLSSFTSNRHALLISEAGGSLVKTPNYTANHNVAIRKVDANIIPDAQIKATVNTEYNFEQSDELSALKHYLSDEKLIAYLNKKYSISDYEIDRGTYKLKELPLNAISEEMQIVINGNLQITDKRIFIQPNLLNKLEVDLAINNDRSTDIYIIDNFTKLDTVVVNLPFNCTMETGFRKINFSSPIGIYSSEAIIKENKLYYFRKFVQYEGIYKQSQFSEIAKFLFDVAEADAAKIVLTKQ